MTTRLWTTIALSSALLTACYGSDAQTKEGQSHWLTACASQDDCSEGLVCACGVCTMECTSSTGCPGSATCSATAGDARCEDAPSAFEQICLPVPEPVPVPVPVPVPEPDAGDGGEGALSCGEISDRWQETLDQLNEDYTECSTELECTCAPTGTLCQDGCEVAVRGLHRDAFVNAVTTFSADYCSAEEVRETCLFPSAECAACVPVCEQGRCVSVSRTRCVIDSQCEGGQLCHIDETCMDRGVEDGNGVAVLATSDLEARDINTGVAAFALVDGGVVWLTAGTWNEDPLAEVETASVMHLELDSNQVTTLARGIRRADVPALKVSGALAFYTSASGISAVRIDGEGEATLVVARNETGGPSWTVDSDFIYYTPARPDPTTPFLPLGLHRVRHDGTEDAVLFEPASMNGRPGVVSAFAVDEEHIYVEQGGNDDMNPMTQDPTSLLRMGKDGSSPSIWIGQFRYSESPNPLLVGEGRIFAETGYQLGIQANSLTDGERVELVAGETRTPFLYIRSISDGYLYYSEYIVDDPQGRGSWLSRVAMSGGEPERVREQITAGNHIVAADGYLYWDEMGRLLRKAL